MGTKIRFFIIRRTVPTHHFDLIRSLRLSWTFSQYIKTNWDESHGWGSVYQALPSMPNLREIEILVLTDDFHHHRPNCIELDERMADTGSAWEKSLEMDYVLHPRDPTVGAGRKRKNSESFGSPGILKTGRWSRMIFLEQVRASLKI